MSGFGAHGQAAHATPGVKIGVLGGTFDPIHNGHVELARAAIEQVGLDRVLFVVSARPPHKRGETRAASDERFRLVEAALAGAPNMEACGIELEREGPSYTADTLIALEKEYPGAKFWLILGMDSLVDLPKWRRPDEILRRARLLVAPRADELPPIPDAVAGHYDALEFAEMDVSSTEVRERLARGESIAGLVPESVERMILDEGLYGTGVQDRARG